MDQNSKKYKNKFLTIIEKVKIDKAVNSILKFVFSVFLKKFNSFKNSPFNELFVIDCKKG